MNGAKYRAGLNKTFSLKWLTQSLDLNPIKNMWKDETSVHRRSNLIQLCLTCFVEEQWANISVSRCAKLGNTYWLITFTHSTFRLFFFLSLKSYINCFSLHDCDPLDVDLSHKIQMKYIFVCSCDASKSSRVMDTYATHHIWLFQQTGQ